MSNRVLGVKLVEPIKVNAEVAVTMKGDSAYEIAVSHGFVGTEDEWLKSLKGQDGHNGKDANADKAYSLLAAQNIYCESKSVDDVICGVIKALGSALTKTFKPLEWDRPTKGQTYINLYGEPHFKVALLGKGIASATEISDSGNTRLDLDSAFNADDIQLEYFNLLGAIVGTYRVTGYSDVKTEIKAREFEGRGDLTEINYPEVTTVGEYAFKNCSSVNIIKLPKAKRIADNAFDGISYFNEIRLESYIATASSFLWRMEPIVNANIYINEASDLTKAAKMLTDYGYRNLTIFNADGTKRVDKDTKTWVVVQ